MLAAAFVAGGGGRVADAAPAGTAASASPKAAARKKLMEGAELLKKRDFQAALERFQSAYEILPSPKIQYNLGLAYMGLGRNADALAAFHNFLSEADDASGETITSARKYKEALVQKIFRLTVSADVEGASIGVDGRTFGNTPHLDEIILDAGAHALVVDKPGVGKPFTKRFDAAPGGSLAIEAKLLPPKPARSNRVLMEASRTSGANSGAAGVGRAPMGVVTASSSTPGSGRRTARVAAYATGGLALVALGFGTFEWVTKERKYSSFNDHCGKANLDLGGPDCRPLLNDGDHAKTLGYVGFAVAGALGVASTVLFVLSGHDPGTAAVGKETALVCAPDFATPGGVCRLRF
jgi:hypothetical protein